MCLQMIIIKLAEEKKRGKFKSCTLCFATYSALTEFLPWFSRLALENQAYTLNHQLAFANFEFLERACQQFQQVAPRPQLSPYQPLLELKHLTPTQENSHYWS